MTFLRPILDRPLQVRMVHGRISTKCISVADSMIPEKNETELYIDEATALEYYVEICPHEKLYFPRLQKIVNLPGFKTSTSNTEINALTQGSNKHYSAIDEEGTYQCVIQNGDSRSRFYACGEIKFSYARWYDPLKWTGPHPGLLLQSDWYLWLYHFPMEINTLDGVEQFYAANPVSLCPHTKLIDVVGPQRLLNSLQSYRQTLDPVLDYELKHVKKGKEECKYCHSSFQSELRGVGQDTFLGVTCIRLLGKADSPNDSIWLSQ